MRKYISMYIAVYNNFDIIFCLYVLFIIQNVKIVYDCSWHLNIFAVWKYFVTHYYCAPSYPDILF